MFYYHWIPNLIRDLPGRDCEVSAPGNQQQQPNFHNSPSLSSGFLRAALVLRRLRVLCHSDRDNFQTFYYHWKPNLHNSPSLSAGFLRGSVVLRRLRVLRHSDRAHLRHLPLLGGVPDAPQPEGARRNHTEQRWSAGTNFRLQNRKSLLGYCIISQKTILQYKSIIILQK